MQNRTLRHLIFFSVLALWFSPSITSAAQISISRIDNALTGQTKTLTISADSIVNDISGFNLTIAHEGMQATVYDINSGDIFDSCGWEYFSYRRISADTVLTYFPEYPVNLINIVGLASLSGNPSTSCNLSSATLAELDIQLSRNHQGHFPGELIRYSFFWRDCNDNVLTSVSGDTLFTAESLFADYSAVDPIQQVTYAFPGYGIPDPSCPNLQGKEVLSNIKFVNSAIIWDYGDYDWCWFEVGDINLNGFAFEVADAVMFIDYFRYGLGIFTIHFPGQIAQTDINCDGVVLSVADLVLLFRIISGNYWYFKPAPTHTFESNLSVSQKDYSKELRFVSNSEISLLYLRIFPEDGQQLSLADFQYDHPNLMTGQIGDTITMLFVDLEDNQVLSSGTHSIFEYSGDINFNLLGSAVDVYGRETALIVAAETVLPESPILHQNYPNPFNPSTTIEFNLPAETDWKLEIYNVNGQKIKGFSGNGIGSQAVFWNGTNNSGQIVSSGVYFYKLMASDVSNGRKMLLLK